MKTECSSDDQFDALDSQMAPAPASTSSSVASESVRIGPSDRRCRYWAKVLRAAGGDVAAMVRIAYAIRSGLKMRTN